MNILSNCTAAVLTSLMLLACGASTDIEYTGQGTATGGGGTSSGGTSSGGTSSGGTSSGGTSSGGTSSGGTSSGGTSSGGGAPGGTGGGGAPGGSGGATVCGGKTCKIPTPPFGQLTGCCAGAKCGASFSLLGPQCIELNQAGKPNPTCPNGQVGGISLAGCCKPNGKCGVQDTFIGFGCVDPEVLGGGPSPKCTF